MGRRTSQRIHRNRKSWIVKKEMIWLTRPHIKERFKSLSKRAKFGLEMEPRKLESSVRIEHDSTVQRC